MHVSCEENSVDSSRVKMPTDSIYKRICRYNLFASKADDDAQPFEDRAMEIKQQQYSTWLYILFLAGKLDQTFLYTEEERLRFSIDVRSYVHRAGETGTILGYCHWHHS